MTTLTIAIPCAQNILPNRVGLCVQSQKASRHFTGTRCCCCILLHNYQKKIKKCQHKYNSLKKGGVADKEKQVTPVLEQGETGVCRDVRTFCKVKVEF